MGSFLFLYFKPWDNLLRSECVRKEKYTVLSRIVYFGGDYEGRVKVLPHNGSLLIQDLGFSDRGKYRCYAWNNMQQFSNINNATSITNDLLELTESMENEMVRNLANSSQRAVRISRGNSIKLIIETEYRRRLYTLSLVYGFATAGGFLLITLLAKLVCFLLHK